MRGLDMVLEQGDFYYIMILEKCTILQTETKPGKARDEKPVPVCNKDICPVL
jgi:hypothetical protein